MTLEAHGSGEVEWPNFGGEKARCCVSSALQHQRNYEVWKRVRNWLLKKKKKKKSFSELLSDKVRSHTGTSTPSCRENHDVVGHFYAD